MSLLPCLFGDKKGSRGVHPHNSQRIDFQQVLLMDGQSSKPLTKRTLHEQHRRLRGV